MRRNPATGETPVSDSGSSFPPSKSQRKRDSHALQELGEQLVELSDERLLQLPITERMIDAVRLARGIRAHEGRRRQMQFIGRLMREADHEAIRQVIEGDRQLHRAETALMHAAEQWRERLLDDPAAVNVWLERHPETGQGLTVLIEKARSEIASGQRGRRYRELFRLVRTTLGSPTPPASSSAP
jgi:ribosome-associated protein